MSDGNNYTKAEENLLAKFKNRKMTEKQWDKLHKIFCKRWTYKSVTFNYFKEEWEAFDDRINNNLKLLANYFMSTMTNLLLVLAELFILILILLLTLLIPFNYIYTMFKLFMFKRQWYFGTYRFYKLSK